MNKKEAEEKLRALGKSAEEIRESLIKMGIKGSIFSACRCPIAKYLNEGNQGNNNPRFSVSAALVGYEKHVDPANWRYDWEFHPPYEISEFIKNFDMGLYPELVLEE